MTKNYKVKTDNATIGYCKFGKFTELMLLDGVYYTPDNLYQKGMCACNNCGTIMPIDKKHCPYCNEWIIIIHERFSGKYNTSNIPMPRKDETRAVFVDRAFRDEYLQSLFPIGAERWKEAERIYQLHSKFE